MTAESDLIRLATGPPEHWPGHARRLHGVDPDVLGFPGWRALLVMSDVLDPGSVWATRTRSLRRRSHYAAHVAATAAARLHHALAEADVPHSFFADVALAHAYGQRAGDQPIGTMSVWVDPSAPRSRVEAALSQVTNGAVVTGDMPMTARAQGLILTAYAGWPRLMGRIAGPCGTRRMDTRAGPIPIADPVVEVHRLLTLRTLPHYASWLLDLRVVTAGHPEVWQEEATLAGSSHRARSVRASWTLAQAAGVAPTVARLPRDPWLADVRQRLA